MIWLIPNVVCVIIIWLGINGWEVLPLGKVKNSTVGWWKQFEMFAVGRRVCFVG